MDEMRAAILRVKLRKLPRIINSMHDSKYRVRQGLGKFPQISFRCTSGEQQK